MASSQDLPVPLLLLIPVAFAVVFPLFWCGVCLLLSFIGGWRRLARRYATDRPPTGTAFHGLHAGVGLVSYKGCLDAHVAPEGLYLEVAWPFRVGHPRLLVPWDAIHDLQERQLLRFQYTSFSVGAPRVARVHLPARVLAARFAAAA
jgi:hypothetical protein